MSEIAIVCSVVTTFWTVKPWRAGPWLWRRVRPLRSFWLWIPRLLFCRRDRHKWESWFITGHSYGWVSHEGCRWCDAQRKEYGP